jgi:hypothetical protein
MDVRAGTDNDQIEGGSGQIELALDEIQLDEKQVSEKHYDTAGDEEDVRVEVITADGGTHKFTFPPTATVLMLKQQVEHNAGFKSAGVKLYVHDDSREEALGKGERLGSLRRGKGLAVQITLMVHTPDAQELIPGLAAKADLVLGDGFLTVSGEPGSCRYGSDDQLNTPYGVAFMPAHPDWVVTTENNGHRPGRIKISNIRTGALVCKFDEDQDPATRLHSPWGVAITSDSSFVIVADCYDVTVLRLVVAADGSSVHLEFVRRIGNGKGSGEGQLKYPRGVALLIGEGGGQETVLVTDDSNHRMSHFMLDGTFIRIFAGTGTKGSGDGEFAFPYAITVLGSSGEVAVADCNNHRVQIFDREGNYKRQFGTYGKETDGQFDLPSSLASDVHGNLLVLDFTNRLQVFSPEGKHLCTRNDLGLKDRMMKGIAWSDVGELAVANGSGHIALVWRKYGQVQQQQQGQPKKKKKKKRSKAQQAKHKANQHKARGDEKYGGAQ